MGFGFWVHGISDVVNACRGALRKLQSSVYDRVA